MNLTPADTDETVPQILLVVHSENPGCSLQQGSVHQRRQFAGVNEAITSAIDSYEGPIKITVMDERNVQIISINTAAVPGRKREL